MVPRYFLHSVSLTGYLILFASLTPEIEVAFSPLAGRGTNLLEVGGDRRGYGYHRRAVVGGRPWTADALSIEPRRAANTPGEPVDGQRGEDTISRIGVLEITAVVTPAVQFLDDPSRHGSRGVCQVADGLRPGDMHLVVPDARPPQGRYGLLSGLLSWCPQVHCDGYEVEGNGHRRMESNHGLGVGVGELLGHGGTPVRSVHPVALVAQDVGHQMMKHGCGLDEADPRTAQWCREPVAWEIGDHELEIAQAWKHLGKVPERPRPAPDEQQRESSGPGDVDVVNRLLGQLHPVVGVGVDRLFVGAPVIAVLPGVQEVAQVGLIGAVPPGIVAHVARQPGDREALAEVVDLLVIDVNLELFRFHAKLLFLCSPQRDAAGEGTARPGCQLGRVPAARLLGPARADQVQGGVLHGWRGRDDTRRDRARGLRPRSVLLLARPHSAGQPLGSAARPARASSEAGDRRGPGSAASPWPATKLPQHGRPPAQPEPDRGPDVPTSPPAQSVILLPQSSVDPSASGPGRGARSACP